MKNIDLLIKKAEIYRQYMQGWLISQFKMFRYTKKHLMPSIVKHNWTTSI